MSVWDYRVFGSCECGVESIIYYWVIAIVK